MSALLVCRPEPGASATAAAARALGLTPVVSPLFRIAPIPWDPPPPASFDALAMTSANAARHAGPGLARYAALPAFGVGDATAAAMRDAGLAPQAGGGGAAPLMTTIADGPHRRVLHLCGEHHRAPLHASLSIRSVPVYRAIAADTLPASAIDALTAGAVVLVHSPRAAALLARLAGEAGVDKAAQRVVAISVAAADAAGSGWRSLDAAPAPTDAAMLAIARKLCENPMR